MRFSQLLSKLPLYRPAIGLALAGIIVVIAGRAGGVSTEKEVDWLNRLANSGNPGAQLQLGLAYRDGRLGLTPDIHAARHWLAIAARNGDAYAADATANSYAAEQGNPANREQALYWWKQAAREGNADAQTHLGEAMLAQGEKTKAVTWLRNAADRGNSHARADLAQLYRKSMATDADLHRGENQVAALSERLDAKGLNTLFTFWRDIENGSPLMKDAVALISRAHSGDPVAEYQLGLRYCDGSWAVNRNRQQAIVWLQRAAEAGNPLAAKSLDRIRKVDKPRMTAVPASIDSHRS
jgi:TPR repeat protein